MRKVEFSIIEYMLAGVALQVALANPAHASCPKLPDPPPVVVLSEMHFEAAGGRRKVLEAELESAVVMAFEECRYVAYGPRDVDRALRKIEPFLEGYSEIEQRNAAVRDLDADLVLRVQLQGNPPRLAWWLDRSHDFKGRTQTLKVPSLDALPDIARQFATAIRKDVQAFLHLETPALIRNSLGAPVDAQARPVEAAIGVEDIGGFRLVEERASLESIGVQVTVGEEGQGLSVASQTPVHQRLALVFLIDNSSSMWLHDPAGRRVKMVRDQLAIMHPEDRAGVIKFNSDVAEAVRLSKVAELRNPKMAAELEGAFFAYGQTNYGDAFAAAQKMLLNAPPGYARVVLFVTDGQPTIGPDTASIKTQVKSMGDAGIKIHTIGLAKEDGFAWMGDFDPAFLAALAEAGRGRSFSVDAGRLHQSVSDLLEGASGQHTVAEATVDLGRQKFSYAVDGGSFARLTFRNLPKAGQLVLKSPVGKLYRYPIPKANTDGLAVIELQRQKLVAGDQWVGSWEIAYLKQAGWLQPLAAEWIEKAENWLFPKVWAAEPAVGDAVRVTVTTDGDLRLQSNLRPNYEYGQPVRFSVMAAGPMSFTKSARLVVTARPIGGGSAETFTVDNRRSGFFLVSWQPSAEGRFEVEMRVDQSAAGELFVERRFEVAVKAPVAEATDCQAAAVQSESAGWLPREFYEQPSLRYTVRAGDWLTKISQRYLGTIDNFWQIYELNKDQIRNVDRIQIGQVFELPRDPRDVDQWKSQLPEGCR